MTTAIALRRRAALVRLLANRPWRPLRVLVDVPVVVIGGVGLFLATWWRPAQAMGMPFLLPFRILDLELRDAAGSSVSWRENPRVLLDLVSYVALWVSPYLILLFVWAGLARVGDLTVRPVAGLLATPAPPARAGEPWGMRPVDFVLLPAGPSPPLYLIKLAASFPKYHITMMPFWAMGIAYLLSRYVKRIPWWELPRLRRRPGRDGRLLRHVRRRSFVLFGGYDFVFPLLVWPAALGFAFLVLGACFGRLYLPRQLAILGMLLTLGWSWGVQLRAGRADYSTAYNYRSPGNARRPPTRAASCAGPGVHRLPGRGLLHHSQELYVDQDTFWEHLARLSEGASRPSTAASPATPAWTWSPSSSGTPTSAGSPTPTWTSCTRSRYQSGPFVVFVRTSP